MGGHEIPAAFMERNPLTRQRSKWVPVSDDHLAFLKTQGVEELAVSQRNVNDGHLTAIVAREPIGSDGAMQWHLSISHRTNHRPPRPGRYPTWDEIADARYLLLPDDRTFVMELPPPAEYVAVHDTTFHLHEKEAA